MRRLHRASAASKYRRSRRKRDAPLEAPQEGADAPETALVACEP